MLCQKTYFAMQEKYKETARLYTVAVDRCRFGAAYSLKMKFTYLEGVIDQMKRYHLIVSADIYDLNGYVHYFYSRPFRYDIDYLLIQGAILQQDTPAVSSTRIAIENPRAIRSHDEDYT